MSCLHDDDRYLFHCPEEYHDWRDVPDDAHLFTDDDGPDGWQWLQCFHCGTLRRLVKVPGDGPGSEWTC